MESNLVNEHRQAIFLSGNVSDFQLKNLQTWPFIVFDNLKNVQIDYDFKDTSVETKDTDPMPIGSGKVIFDFQFDKKAKVLTKNKEKALSSLELWTKFLFWSDTEVIFKRNGKIWK